MLCLEIVRLFEGIDKSQISTYCECGRGRRIDGREATQDNQSLPSMERSVPSLHLNPDAPTEILIPRNASSSRSSTVQSVFRPSLNSSSYISQTSTPTPQAAVDIVAVARPALVGQGGYGGNAICVYCTK